MARLIALKPHSPDGSIRHQPGDAYEISESAARVLVATKRAKRATPDDESPDSKSKKEYKTRVLTAEK